MLIDVPCNAGPGEIPVPAYLSISKIMKKLSFLFLFLFLFASCEKKETFLNCMHPSEITFINNTGLDANIEVRYIATIITIKKGTTEAKDPHVKIGYDRKCIVGSLAVISMYDRNEVGWATLYQWEELISDTVMIDSCKFNH